MSQGRNHFLRTRAGHKRTIQRKKRRTFIVINIGDLTEGRN